ncbi:MAG: hypothetical protein V4754_11565 [Pseudomonadota bacterium]
MNNNATIPTFKVRLRAAGFGWIFCLTFIALFLEMLSTLKGLSIIFAKTTFITGLVIGISCFVGSYFAPNMLKRVLIETIILGSTFIAVSLIPLFFSIAYFFIDFNFTLFKIINLISIFLFIFGICIHSTVQLKKEIVDNDFINKEFKIEPACIIMKNLFNNKIKFSKKNGTANKNVTSLRSWKILILLSLTYPLERAITSTNGVTSAFLLMAIISLPLTFYMLQQLTRGIYIKIYIVLKLEREHKKKVLFSDRF